MGGVPPEYAVLVDQPHDRRREDHQERRGGDQHQVDLAHPDRDRAAHRRRVAAGRHPAERREQHRRDRDAEHSLGQHVDAKRLVDRARGAAGRVGLDETAERRVDQLVKVDDAEADRDRQHQHEDLANTRVVPVDVEREPEVDLGEREHRHQQLHAGGDEDRDRVGLDPVVGVHVARPQIDDQADDHEIPDRGSDRRNREAVI